MPATPDFPAFMGDRALVVNKFFGLVHQMRLWTRIRDSFKIIRCSFHEDPDTMSIYPNHRPVDRGEQGTGIVRKLLIAGVLAFAARETYANLTVDDSLNRYSLYGRKIMKIEYAASTSQGGWIGSDSLVQIDATDTIRSTVTSGKDFQINNGADWIWGNVRVANDLGGATMYDDSIMGSTYVGHNLTMAQLNILKGPVYTGATLTVAVWNHNYYNGSDFYNASAGTSFNSPTSIPGLTWGVRPEATPYSAWTFPDTTFSTSSITIITSFTTRKDGTGKCRWTCGSNKDAGGSDLGGMGICATADSILPPGTYGDVTLWYGSTLFLGEGAYTFNNVTLPPSSGTDSTRLLARQPNGARTVILVKGKLDAQASGRLNVIAPESYAKGYGTDSAHFAGGTLMVYAEQPVSLGVGLELWATLVVPNHSVTLNDQVHLFGQILADSILVKNKFRGTGGAFIPYSPNKPVITVANFWWKGTEGPAGFIQNANFILQMNHVNGLPVKVFYHTEVPTHDTTIGGVLYSSALNTATPGPQDYRDTSGSVTIAPTVTSDTISVPVHGNYVRQPNRYFILVLDSIQNGTFDSTSMWNGHVAGLALILDDDPAPTFRISGYTAYEGTGPGTKPFKFFLQLVDSTTGNPIAPASSGGATFTWSTIKGTADSTDYMPVHGTKIVWPSGKSSDTLIVQVWQDSTYESNETFSVHIDTFSNVDAKSAWCSRTATGTILNDDSAPTVQVNDASALAGSPVVFTVSLSIPSAIKACFDWATADVTALAGTDYNATSGTGVCIAAGATTATLSVPTISNGIYEPTKTFNILLHPVSGITVAGSDTLGVGAILNANRS